VLDIVKPWPARRFERLHGGLGVMADDLMAGLYGNLLLQAAVRLAPGWL
jgi:phosphatidylglycerophosphatase A